MKADTSKIFEIVNKAAKAYEGVIAEDCYHRPYMSRSGSWSVKWPG